MFHKCCIPNCGSRRKDVLLYRFPKTEIVFQKWLKFINCNRLRNLSVEKILKKYVCKKHFEKKFIASTPIRSRLVVGAYPTLFADSEISSGIPLKKHSYLTTNAIKKNLQRKAEHSYTKKLHVDHTYTKLVPMEKLSRIESDEDAQCVDLRESTPLLSGSSITGESTLSPSQLYGNEAAGYSQLSLHEIDPPFATPTPQITAPAFIMSNKQKEFRKKRLQTQPRVQGTQQPEMLLATTNITECTARYSGVGDVIAFINAVQIYKDSVGAGDDVAFRDLPLLLTDIAATWWLAVKSSVTNWQEAINLLRQSFSPRLPPHSIYRELFSREQGQEGTEIFISRLRALFAQLPPNTVPENPVQLDMVYGLLHKRIREKLERNAFSSFAELLQKVREVENTFKDVCTVVPVKTITSPSTLPATPTKTDATLVSKVKLNNSSGKKTRIKIILCHIQRDSCKFLRKNNLLQKNLTRL